MLQHFKQDPDVILIGETQILRPQNQLWMLLNWSFSFHNTPCQSAISALTRLIDMEVPKYKLNSSLRGVLHKD